MVAAHRMRGNKWFPSVEPGSGRWWQRGALSRQHHRGVSPYWHFKWNNQGNELWSWLLTCCPLQWETDPSTADLPLKLEIIRGHRASSATVKGNLMQERPTSLGNYLLSAKLECLLLVIIVLRVMSPSCADLLSHGEKNRNTSKILKLKAFFVFLLMHLQPWRK